MLQFKKDFSSVVPRKSPVKAEKNGRFDISRFHFSVCARRRSYRRIIRILTWVGILECRVLVVRAAIVVVENVFSAPF